MGWAAAEAVSVAVGSETMAPRSEPTAIESSQWRMSTDGCVLKRAVPPRRTWSRCAATVSRCQCPVWTSPGLLRHQGVKLVDVGLVVSLERATVRATTMAIERHTGGRYDAVHHASPSIAGARLTRTQPPTTEVHRGGCQ